MQSVGDLAQVHLLRAQQSRLKTNLNKLTQEVSTGLSADPASNLNGNIKNILSLTSKLEKIETYRTNITEAQITTNAMQTALTQIYERGNNLTQSLLTSRLATSNTQLETIGLDAKDSLERTLVSLNTQMSGKFLFSGTATDRQAVVNIDTMMTDLRALASGITSANELEAALDTWFISSGGGFESTHYTGSTTRLTNVVISEGLEAKVNVTANDQPIRELMKSMALAALATDPATNLDPHEKIKAMSKATVSLVAAQDRLVAVQEDLGQTEAKIDEAKTFIESEKTVYQMTKLDYVAVDQYDTAVKYEEARNQIETIFAITARSQRLSLTGFIQ